MSILNLGITMEDIDPINTVIRQELIFPEKERIIQALTVAREQLKKYSYLKQCDASNWYEPEDEQIIDAIFKIDNVMELLEKI